MRVVVLSPHLDDAVLSAWSPLRTPGETIVVNVCSGLPPEGLLSPWDRLTGASSSRARMLERKREDGVALGRVGREAIELDFPEAQYRDGPLDDETLRSALTKVIDGADRVWAPAGIGGHHDHLQVREAALAIHGAGGPPLTLYADLPYAVRYGWPGWVSNHEDDPYLVVEEWWRDFLPVGLVLSPKKHALSSAEAEGKLDAIRAYRTQLAALNFGPVELLQQPSVIGHEVSWEVE